MGDTTKNHTVVGTAEWQKSRNELLEAEKALTTEHDRVASLRRNMPWMAVSRQYTFDLNGKTIGLGCCMVIDNVGHLSHLHARDVSFAIVATATQAEIAAFQKRMQWDFTWASTTEAFNNDFDVNDGFGLNVFIHQEGTIYRTYFTSARGVEGLGSNWSYLDLTPLGRQENWEESPDGTPQSAPYQWWRLHDSYEPD